MRRSAPHRVELRDGGAVVAPRAADVGEHRRHFGGIERLPTTAGNPRPYGMPPFGQTLDAAEVAAVLTYIRGSWGNDSAPVTQLDTMRR